MAESSVTSSAGEEGFIVLGAVGAAAAPSVSYLSGVSRSCLKQHRPPCANDLKQQVQRLLRCTELRWHQGLLPGSFSE